MNPIINTFDKIFFKTMNKFLITFSFTCLLFSCDIRNNKSTPDEVAHAHDSSGMVFKDSTTVQMIDTVFNFGKITDGEKTMVMEESRDLGANGPPRA